MSHRPFSLLLPVLLAVGCADQRLSPEGEPDGAKRYAEGSAEAELIVRASNELTLVELDEEVGLDGRAAEGLVAARSGPDGVDGTGDDTPFQTLAEVDAVPYVGEASLEALLVFARELWASVHGFLEGSPEAELILEAANTSTLATLQDQVGLSDLAAMGIVEGRSGPDGLDGTGDDTPFQTLAALDDAPWVDGAVFQALLDHGQALPQDGDCPEGYILASDGNRFTDLKTAAETSPPGTLLDVCSDVTLERDIIPNGVTFRGRGATVIRTGGHQFKIRSRRSATFEGFSFQGAVFNGVLMNSVFSNTGNSSLTVRDSEFLDNERGVIHSEGSLVLENVRIEGTHGTLQNVSLLNVITLYGGSARFTDVTFRGNHAEDHMLSLEGSDLVGERVSIVDNDSGYSTVRAFNGSISLFDSEILENDSENSIGGIWLFSGTVSARDVDFQGNTLGDIGIGLYGLNSEAPLLYRYGLDAGFTCDELGCW